MRAEILRRAERSRKDVPRLVIVIDECTALLRYMPTFLDELFSIASLEQETGIHLLLSAPRLEESIGDRIRTDVHYRLCLRCKTVEDSRSVLLCNDAALLPAAIPGRGYLRHRNGQLDLFQSCRVSLTIPV